MPTGFVTSYNDGDVIYANHNKQYAPAVNRVEDGSAFWAVDSGSTDNYAATLATDVTSYTAGLFVHLKPNTSNDGTATLNLNSVGSNVIKKGDGTQDLEPGDLIAGNIYLLVHNGTNFVLITGNNSLSSSSLTFSAINGEAFSIKKGQPVKLFSTGNPPTVKLAQANSSANSAYGLATELVASGAIFSVIKIGIVTNSDWTDIIGSTNLTFNQEYWVGQGTSGVLSASPPSGSGDVVQSVGKAISTTRLYVFMDEYYQL